MMQVLSQRFGELERVAVSDFSSVYRARDLIGKHTAALKVAVAPRGVQSDALIREFNFLSKVWHPNIVRAYDFGIAESGCPFFAMEWVPGLNFSAAAETYGPLAVLEAIPSLCSALAEVHELGYVYGDLHPLNILITGVPSGTKATLIDFGMVSKAGTSHAKELWGTPDFMAPEASRGDPVTPATDVYAFGVLLQQLLRRACPDSLVSLTKRFDFAALSELARACLEYQPELRPQGFREIESTWGENIADYQASPDPSTPIKKASNRLHGQDVYLRELRRQCAGLLDRGGGVVLVAGNDGVGKSTLIGQHRRMVQLQGHSTLRLICDKPTGNAAAIRAAIEAWLAQTGRSRQPDSHNGRALFVYLEADRRANQQTGNIEWLRKAIKGHRIACLVESPATLRLTRSEDIRTLTLEPLSRETFERACATVFAETPFIFSLVSFLYHATGGLPGPLLAKKLEYTEFIRREHVPDRFNWRRAPQAFVAGITRSFHTLPPTGQKVARSCALLRAPFSSAEVAEAASTSVRTAEMWLRRLLQLGVLETIRMNGRALYDICSLWVDDVLRRLPDHPEAHRIHRPGEARGRAASTAGQRRLRRFLTTAAGVREGGRTQSDYRDLRYLPEAVVVCRNLCRRTQQWGEIPDTARRAAFSAVVSTYEAIGNLTRARKWAWRMANQELVSASTSQRPTPEAVVATVRMLDKYCTPDQKSAWITAIGEACPNLDSQTVALLTSERGAVDIAHNNLEAALSRYLQAEAHYSHLGIRNQHRARNLSRIGVVHQLRKEYERAMEFFTLADEMAEESADLETRIIVKMNAGTVLLDCGLAREALRHFTAAKAAVKQTHNLKMQSYIDRNMVLCVADLEPASAAVCAASAALTSCRKAQESGAEPACHSNLGWAYFRAGDVARARTCLQLSVGMAVKTDNLRVLAPAFLNLARLSRLQGAYAAAISSAVRSFRAAERNHSPHAQAAALRELSLSLLAAGKVHAAERWLGRAIGMCPPGADLRSTFFSDLATAEIAIRCGDLDSAANTIRTWNNVGPERMLPGWRCALGRLRGLLLLKQGNPDSAICEFKDAAILARKLGRYDLLLPIYEALHEAYAKTARPHAALPFTLELGRLYRKVGHMSQDSKLDETIRELARGAEGAPMADMIFQLSESLTRFSDKRHLLDHLLGLAVEYFGADRGALVSQHPISKRFFIETHRGLDSALDQDDALRISRTVVRKVSQSGEALKVNDAQRDALTKTKKSIIQQNIQSVLCVPVITGGNVWGVLYLDNRSVPEAFKHTDVKVLQSLANFMALAIGQSDEFARLKLQTENETTPRGSDLPFIAVSQRMRSLLAMIDKIADSTATVVILGENGTGKDVLARYIHLKSGRRAQPFITMNCAGLVETLASSELFGIEDNVATGVKFREGKFKLADGGTLFLNEIGDLPLSIQSKLLQALQDGIIERVGGTPIGVDVRFIAATNKDLKHMVAAGQFREDLFYRINSITVSIPPLRERAEDIPHLARGFLDHFCGMYGRTHLELDKENLDEFVAYPWPGNVRELKAVIERGVLLSDGGRFPSGLTGRLSTVPGRQRKPAHKLDKILIETERQCITEALLAAGWNQSKAATRLGLSESTLRSKMQKLLIKKPQAM